MSISINEVQGMIYFNLKRDNKVVGHLHIELKGNGEACLDNLFVEKEYRGNKLSDELWDSAKTELLNRNIATVVLEAWDRAGQGGSLERLYQSWGFETFGSRIMALTNDTFMVKSMRFNLRK